MITIKSPREVETMAAAGRIVADTLAVVAREVRPGVSTEADGAIDEDLSGLRGKQFEHFGGENWYVARRHALHLSLAASLRLAPSAVVCYPAQPSLAAD